MTPDSELLGTFARTNSEEAFAEVVKRHVNLVYSAALRQVGGDAHMAKDVAQNVFTDLARKAASLARRESLSGWLYTSVHFAAAKVVRTETRRRDREERFMRDSENENTAGNPPAALENEWLQVSVALDAVMHELKEADRDAILLRYFENRPFAEVGAKLGLNENAARMRVERALEKLRAVFAKRGLVTTAGFASVISANAVQLAPVNMAAMLTTMAIASTGAGTLTLFKIMTATKVKIGLAALIVVGGVAAFVLQQQVQEKLRGDNAALQQQIAQLQTDNQSLSNRLASTADAKKLSDNRFNELLKLRGEVGVLQNQATDIQQDNAALKKRLANISRAETNLAPELQVHIKASFIDVPINGFATPEAAANGLTGILNHQEFTNELAILEKREGAINEGEPEVTTTSGRQTQMRATSVITVITNYAFVESNVINGANTLVPQTAQVETGPIIDIIPQILSDGRTVSLPVTASDTEFLDYADPTNKTLPAYTKSGEEVDVPQLNPKFCTLEASTKANVWDGQTLVFQPAWKQDSGDALLQSTNNPDALKTIRLVFITVNIVDSSGRLKYQQDETNSIIPPQPDPASN